MPLSVHLATAADLPAIVKQQYAAFHPNDTLHVLIFPSPLVPTPATIEKTTSRHLKTWEADKHITWLKVVDTDEESGKEEIIGAAKWFVWPDSEGDDKRFPDKVTANWIEEAKKAGTIDGHEQPLVGTGPDDEEYVEWVLDQFFSRRRERFKGRCVVLDMCFVSPDHHRRGAGALLVQWGTSKADEMGVKAFVEASLLGRRLYEGNGFVITERVLLDGAKQREEWKDMTPVEYLFMEREVRAE